MRILLIDDDLDLLSSLSQRLTQTYLVDTATNANQAEDYLSTTHYDIIILDYLLPDSTGLKLTKSIRQQLITTPILFLSGEARTSTKISALDAGADDYLTKPFSLNELLARLRAITRRTPKLQHQIISSGPLQLNLNTYTVTHHNKTILLRRKELLVLKTLMLANGSVVTRDILKDRAWDANKDSYTNTIDVHIKYLRDKIDKPFGTQIIKTVHGLGYKLEFK